MAVSLGGKPRAAYLRPSMVALVVVGGMAGTALRDLIERVFPAASGTLPWATVGINVVGAFLLGVLLEVLTLAAPGGGRRRALQLTLGTGFLGGFTTYSTFVVESINLGNRESMTLALLYAVGSVLAGFMAALVAMGATRAVVRARWKDSR